MSLTKKEQWEERILQRKSEKIKQNTFEIQGMMQTAQDMELLTNDPLWDKYVSFLASVLDTAKTAAQRAQQDLADPTRVNADEIMAVKMVLVRLNERISVLETVIQIPGMLVKEGAVAKEVFKEQLTSSSE